MQRYNIAKEGAGILAAFVIFYVITFALSLLQPSLVVLVLLLFVAYFFREPERKIVFPKNSVISPGQGRVTCIENRTEDEFLNKELQCISIFLSVFDVHVNYVPFDGKVEDVKYRKGQFHNAIKGKASAENERVSVLFSTEEGHIVVRQIAGLIARRIVCHAKPGDRLKKGKRYGIIRFGSRVDIFLPEGAKVKVQVGDKVTAGLTELAVTQ